MSNEQLKPQLQSLVTDLWGVAGIFELMEQAIDDVKAPICAYTLALKNLKEAIRTLDQNIETI
jgi:hypothetical protein